MSIRRYFRVMLGRKSVYAKQCFEGSFIGADFLGEVDLKNELTEEWKEFNKKFIPTYLKENPDRSKVAAGLACGFLWTVSRGINRGDVVLCPNGEGAYFVGEVTSGYFFKKGENLPHRRSVKWSPIQLPRTAMSQSLKNSTGSIGTVSEVSKFADEIEKLIAGDAAKPSIVSASPEIEDPAAFALEEHLEEFLVKNWEQTELGKKYDIYEEEGEIVGQQYPSDTGPIDILAISKNKKELLVVELKRGRASDVVVGQIQRYMGFVQEELAEDGQAVKGAIIALEDDLNVRRALQVTKNIEFFKYQISFKLSKMQES
ncbi:MAG: DUF1016 family protein [Bdellovibrionales bacterium]|nr:DUF1016 family protein [Bdellovibrionales bacterium]